MFGILLIYFIGKRFYQLANLYRKNGWGYAVLGVISYYAGTFLGGMILAILWDILFSDSMDASPSFILSLLVVPMGLLACWGFYKILETQWEKGEKVSDTEILDEDFVG